MLIIAPIFISIPLLTAAYFDYCQRRIPNAVTVPLLAAGVFLQGILQGGDGLINSIFGIAVGGGLFLLLYFFNAMGAGDVKLGAALGSWLGIRFAAIALFYIIFIGGFMAIWKLLFRRQRESVKSDESFAKADAESINKAKQAKVDKETLPYGIAIAGGVFLLFIKILWETQP